MVRLTRSFIAVALVSLGVLSVACDSDSASFPTEEEILGRWANVDDRVRVFEFVASVSADESPALAAKPFVYTLYSYAVGGEPVVAQRGHYSVQEGHVVTELVESPADPSLAGQRFANEIFAWSKTSITLESGSSASGKRVFTKVDALP